MKLPRKSIAVVAALALAVGLATVTGCTKYASPDDLQKLEAAKQAAISAEKELEKAKAEHRKVEAELAAKEKELAAAKAELEKVKAP